MPILKRPASKASGAAATAAAPSASTTRKAETTGAKKQKVDPFVRDCRSVAAGLKEASVPAEVVKMLDAMLGAALQAAKEERHLYQASVVDMVGELLASTETQMAEGVTSVEAAIADLEAQEASRQRAVADAEAVVAAKEEAVQERKRALATEAMAFQSCRSSAAEARAARLGHAKSLEDLASKRGRLAEAQAAFLTPLVSGAEGEDRAKELLAALTKVLVEFDVDASIRAALPNVVCKPLAARGPFDTMVLSQLEAELAKRGASFDATLADGEASTAAAAARERAAEEALAAARARQLLSAQAFKAAGEDRQSAEAACQDARAAQRSAAAETRRRTKERAAAERRLQAFRDGPLATFLSLRDRAASVPEEAPAGCVGDVGQVELVTAEM